MRFDDYSTHAPAGLSGRFPEAQPAAADGSSGARQQSENAQHSAADVVGATTSQSRYQPPMIAYLSICYLC
jgi:hypothetical protein